MPDYHLYTIPIWDAYKKESECAVCDLSRMLEAQYLDAALGGGMMESDIRLETNAQGFCPKHLRDLYAMQSALPLSLMLHTHLKDVIADMEKEIAELDAAIAKENGLPAPQKAVRYLARGGDVGAAADALAQKAEARSTGCHICGKIEHNLARYAEALLAMWADDQEFRQTFETSKGVCVSHLPLLLRTAARKLAGGKRRDFLSTLARLERENLARVEHEIEWFTLKFDYRNTDKPWGNSKDAIPRTMQKLRGPVLEEK
jgi:hypothetical protein